MHNVLESAAVWQGPGAQPHCPTTHPFTEVVPAASAPAPPSATPVPTAAAE